MAKTAVEILIDHVNVFWLYDGAKEKIVEAMEEYASQFKPGNVSPKADENMEAAYLTIDPKYRTPEFRSGFENGWNERGYVFAPLPPVPDADDRLKKELEYIRRNAEKINGHTWETYKEQVLLHLDESDYYAGQQSAPLSPVPVKEEGKELLTDEQIRKMPCEERDAINANWRSDNLGKSPAPTPTEEQDKEVKEVSIREAYYKETSHTPSDNPSKYYRWLENKFTSTPPLPVGELNKMAEERYPLLTIDEWRQDDCEDYHTYATRILSNRIGFIAGYTARTIK